MLSSGQWVIRCKPKLTSGVTEATGGLVGIVMDNAGLLPAAVVSPLLSP